MEDKCLWDKKALIDYVSDIINSNFDNEAEVSLDYGKNYLVIE